MTDEATEVAAEAPAAPEPAPTQEPNESLANVIDRAFETVEKNNRTDERPRDDQGRFTKEGEQIAPEAVEETVEAATDDAEQPQEAETVEETTETPETPASFPDAPERFSADAKQAWADAPEPVRAEITRAVKEMEAGIGQYRDAFEPYKALDAELKQNGQRFEDVLNNYRGIENMLAQDPMRGLDTICRNMGTSLQQVAEAVMQQEPNQQGAQQDTLINDLRGQIAQLQQQITGVGQTVEQQNEAAMQAEINAFAADKPRFGELRETMGRLMESGMANDLQSAYDMADRLNPAPVAAPAEPAPQPEPEKPNAQPRKVLATNGAPASGSNPRNRKPSSSVGDAVGRAFDQIGI